MYSKGDRVKIKEAFDGSWKGKEGVITSVSHFDNNPICYKLDIGGGDWPHHMLEKVEEIPIFAKQEILGLALKEAYRKRDEAQHKIAEMEAIKEDYQIIIDNIRDWQDELKD